MKKKLLELLICPACLPLEHRLKETIEKETGNDIIEGSLTCETCKKTYVIQGGIALLDPKNRRPDPGNKYETGEVLSSYLWSHYGDLLEDDEATDAYAVWADLMEPHGGFSIDAGSAVGRFAFEMGQKSDFCVGLDNSLTFIRAARQLMNEGSITVNLKQEGDLTREATIRLPDAWDSNKVEFIVADALFLPFRSGSGSSLVSLNLVDKVPAPMDHLKEMNRVIKDRSGQFLLSDPFSWSEEAADRSQWLGGRIGGPYAGRGLDNITALLTGKNRELLPVWTLEKQGYVWWKIRTHSNHYELIRSCYVKAKR